MVNIQENSEVRDLIKFHKLNSFTNVEIRENAGNSAYYLVFIWNEIDKVLIKDIRKEKNRGGGKQLVKYFGKLDLALKSINKVGYKGQYYYYSC